MQLNSAKFTELWNRSPLGTVDKRAEVCQWLLHNIIFGFAGAWVPFLALGFFGHWRKDEALRDGELVMFAVTLSAVSLGFFVKETQTSLRKRAILTYAFLMLVMLVGVITRTALAFASKFDVVTLHMPMVTWVTIALVTGAAILNFRLFTLELESLDRKTVADRLNAPAMQLSAQAASANQVDGISV
jgi:hypothetical protein